VHKGVREPNKLREKCSQHIYGVKLVIEKNLQKAEKLKGKKEFHIFDYFQVICARKEAFAAKQRASGINFYFGQEKKSDYTTKTHQK
jgi:hypothetical protein